MKILAIESTCDETAAAIVSLEKGIITVIESITASSAEITSKYGGIVPEVVAREQVASIVPVLETLMTKANLKRDDIDEIAVAYGPGLVGSLLIGIEAAKALALAWNKKLIKVNHLVAHIFANWVSLTPSLPAIALIVSGGHTDFVLVKNLTDWVWLGGTRDDAAGEAFDKAARALGLPYPGGPSIQKAIENLSNIDSKADFKIKLPRPMFETDNLEMSFSGLKTAIVDRVSELKKNEENLSEKMIGQLAKEFNQAVVDVLVKKTLQAIEKHEPKSVILAGGVAANGLLRSSLKAAVENRGVAFSMPELKYCGDNAVMIGVSALLRRDYCDSLELRPDPGLLVV